MNTEELRAQLEKELGQSFRNTAWKVFRSYACVEEFLDKTLSWEDLLEEAEEFLEMWNHEVREEVSAELNLLGPVGEDKDVEPGSRLNPARRKPRKVSHQEQPKLDAEELLRGEVFEEC